MTDKKKIQSLLLKVLMIIVPILIGVTAFLIMSNSKTPPQQKEVTLKLPTVRIMPIKPMIVVPKVQGYGTAEPVRTWKAISQVSGKIIFTHPQLQKGRVIKKGVLLLKIDPSEYLINITKINANIQNYKIQISQKKIEKKNYLRLLNLQKTDLKIKQKEVERQKKLYKRKIISKTEYESKLPGVISQEVQVQNVQNSLNLIPVQIRLLKTQADQAKSDLKSAELKLSYTTVTSPFDMQISNINNKLSEFVQTGQTIFEANDISETEVEAQVVMKSMMPIFISVKERAKNIDLETVSFGQVLGIKATVRLAGSENQDVKWPATLTRRSDSLDTETRTMGFIVTVKNKLNVKGTRRGHLLLKGAYCEVELEGLPIKNTLAIPRSALHPGNIVLLMDSDHKLFKKPVKILFKSSNYVVIKSGLKMGDTLILSDLIPAVIGMKVDPVIDKTAFDRLVADTQGGRK